MLSSLPPGLADRVFIVTGGGRGIGQSFTLALVAAGARVVITAARNPEQLQDTLTQAEDVAGPGRVVGLAADSTDPDAGARIAQAALDAFGRIDGLVNNAGRGLNEIKDGLHRDPPPFWKAPADKWAGVIDVNVKGPYYMARAITPYLLERGWGRIINISTSTQTMIRKAFSPYGPSKAALEAMTRIWAQDLAGTGVTVHALLPGGATDTAFVPEFQGERKGADGNLLPVDTMDNALLWLLSEDSDEFTGTRVIGRYWDAALPWREAFAKARDDHGKLPSLM